LNGSINFIQIILSQAGMRAPPGCLLTYTERIVDVAWSSAANISGVSSR
jgi:hypothetical protein